LAQRFNGDPQVRGDGLQRLPGGAHEPDCLGPKLRWVGGMGWWHGTPSSLGLHPKSVGVHEIGSTPVDVAGLQYASRMAAKVDNNALQDGFQLYHHMFVFTADGTWC